MGDLHGSSGSLSHCVLSRCHPLSVGILEQDLCGVHSFAPTHPPGEGMISGSAAVRDAPAIPYRGHVGRARSAGLRRFGDTSLVGFVSPFLVRVSLL